MIICIGPKNAGKTLLLRRLQQVDTFFNPYSSVFSTIPTVGVNVAKIIFKDSTQMQISELGGSVAAIWPMHFDGCKIVMYVIDVANMQHLSFASILLLEALKHSLLQNSKFLIILNKVDINSSVSISEMKHLLKLHYITTYAKQEIKIIETSCLTGKGIKEIKQYLSNFSS